jgi:hypothetical protein
MRDSRVPQNASIWPLTRLETAMFLLAATFWAAAGVMWAASEPGLLGDIGHLEDLISPRR